MEQDTGPEFLAELLEQEKRLVFTEFGNETALALGLLMVEMAREKSLPVVIDITRSGQQLFHVAMPGSSADNDEWIKRKIATVMRFGHSSYYMGRSCLAKGVVFTERYYLDPMRYAPQGGGFPIIIVGTGHVGTVTVSGLPQAEDHALVVAALSKFLEGRR
ncbi:heme-degrading domain-containing protein [Dongia sp.]|uniref:heme-degrading domain-containing protein n=1 Tax=Dongia sp. TaxID=1977262 RepID=UPI0035B16EA3